MSDSIYKRCKCKDPATGKELGADCPDLRRKGGSWSSAHGTWYFALELPPGPGGKRRPRMRRGGFATREEAEAAQAKAEDVLREGVDPSNRVKLSKYLDDWLAGHVDFKPKTQHNYGWAIETYLKPLLGHIELQNLTVLDITRAFATIREWNEELAAGRPVRKSQRHVGPAAQKRICDVLRSALRDAVHGKLVIFNAAEHVPLEPAPSYKPEIWTPQRVRKFWRDYAEALEVSPITRGDRAFLVWRSRKLRPFPVMVWTADDLGAFLDYAAGRGHGLTPLFELAAGTGMRRGELCALPWENVDLDAGTLQVTAAVVQAGWKVVEGGPKTEAGIRRIPLAAGHVAMLKAHRAAQARRQLEFGPAWTKTDLVFTQWDGKPWHPAAVTDAFERLAFAAHLPPGRLHDVRHAHITYLYVADVDEHVISSRVGHMGKKMTQAYAAVAEEVSHDAAEKAVAMIPRRSAK